MVCAVVRTYPKQRWSVISTILSLLHQQPSLTTTDTSPSQFYPNIHISVVDTESGTRPGDPSGTWSHFDSNPLLAPHEHQLHWPVLPQSVEPQEPDYGYRKTDHVMAALARMNKCDWFLFTNGDNYYSPQLLARSLDLMRSKGQKHEPAVIGWNFLVPMRHQPANLKHSQTKVCRFKHGQVDLGSVLVNSAMVSEFVCA